MSSKNAKAFTLIELSIVLVIIGLIVGGVLVGQDLIRAAELRAVITEKEKFQTAVNSFRTKYNEYPVAITNATTFWSSCIDDPTLGINTCNGDGNISDDDSSRGLRLWEHLGLAGMIAGQYNGHIGTGVDDLEPDINIPRAPISGGLWSFVKTDMDNLYPTYIFLLLLGALDSDDPTNNIPGQSAMIALEAMQLDQKTDDGMPTTGVMRAIDGVDSGTCISGSAYAATETEVGCMMSFEGIID